MESHHESLDVYYLTAMGIDCWQPRTVEASAALDDEWQLLATTAAQCEACELCRTRHSVVFGVGNQQADLMIIGEAPGYHEDQQGEPFVGRAGKLLNAMLLSIGLTRQQVYIANVLKCRPPDNRDPRPEEVLKCTPFLARQIALLNPKLLVAVGRHAAHYLLNTTEALSKLRKSIHYWGDNKVPVVVSYHPAYLLRNPTDKKQAYNDWQQVQKMLS